MGARLARAPKGRKEYQGRVERSHRTDDEEFYLPYLLEIRDEKEFLKKAGSWIFWYNTGRPHFGDKMDGKTPYKKLREDYPKLSVSFCAFPPLLLDKIATNIVLNFSFQEGNNVCDYYIFT